MNLVDFSRLNITAAHAVRLLLSRGVLNGVTNTSPAPFNTILDVKEYTPEPGVIMTFNGRDGVFHLEISGNKVIFWGGHDAMEKALLKFATMSGSTVAGMEHRVWTSPTRYPEFDYQVFNKAEKNTRIGFKFPKNADTSDPISTADALATATAHLVNLHNWLFA